MGVSWNSALDPDPSPSQEQDVEHAACYAIDLTKLCCTLSEFKIILRLVKAKLSKDPLPLHSAFSLGKSAFSPGNAGQKRFFIFFNITFMRHVVHQ
jgi:hypothetical protein